MDKYEYKLKTGQMLELMEDGAFNKAAEIADSIDWKRVRNTKMLTDVSDIYEKNGDYQKSYEVLNIAYHRAEGSRKIVYRLCTLALKTKNVDEAIDYYDDFQQIAPKDPNKFILRYQILRAQRAPIEQQIEALESFKKSEYIGEWAYELAKRYQEAGMTAECLEECDDLILWFNEGKYVYQAMELKMQYKPLTPSQQEKYDNRYARMSNETMEMPNVVEYSSQKGEAAKEESVEEMLAEADGVQAEKDEQPAQETKKREITGRKIGSTMKLDEALKSLLNLGMGEEDKVRDSSSDPVSTDVVFEEDKFMGAIEEIESVADLKLVDEISGQKGLRELKVDPDLEELIPDAFPDDAPEAGGSGHIEPVTTIMQPIHSETAEPAEKPEPAVSEEKTLEELYAEAGESPDTLGIHIVETKTGLSGDTREFGTVLSGDTRILDKGTLDMITGLGVEAGGASAESEEAAAVSAEPETDQVTAGTDEKAGEVIAELDEEARKIFEELDEEARRTIEELEEEEEQPFENMNALTAKASSAEGRDQVEGQMNLLDMMSDLGEESEEAADSQAKSAERKPGEPILPLDIQRMIDEIEGVIPMEEPAEREEQEEKPAVQPDQEPAENMGAVAENLRVDESSEWFEDYDDVLDEEEYPDELPADEEGPENEAYPEDIEISFGGEDEEEAEGYEEEAEYGEISDGAGERFTIEYQEDGEFEYEDEYPNEEPEYEEPELEEIEPAYDEAGQEYEVSEPGYAEEETGYEASEPEYESIEPGYEETEPEYGEVETEYEAAGPEYEEAEAEYEGIETGYEEAEPEYAEEETGYETFEPEYEEAEAGYEGIEAEYDGAEPEYGEIESGYEDEPEYEELEPGYEAAEPEYEDAGEEYEDGGYETGEPEYAEIYEDEEPEYEEEYEEYDPEYTAEYEDEEAVYEGEYEDGQYDEEAEYEGGQYDEEAEYEDDYELDYDEGYAEEDDYEGNYEEEEYYEEDAYYEEEDAEYDAASAEVDLEHEFRPQRSSGRRYDEREVPDEEEEIDILSKSTPLSRKETAKLIATGKTSPLPMDEISDALSLSDTGFVVHGRYDLKTQSGIGTRAGLTEEQKKLFSYFVPVRGMSEQLVDVLEQDKNCTNRRGTSNTGNLLIIGNKGNGKTVLAVDVVKAIQKQRNIRQGRVAIVTGDSLNKKKISDIFSKLYGGALIIEKAGKMNEKTVARVNKAMERDTGELLIVLEDQRKPLDRLLTSNREFRRKFTSRLEVPILINDELVTFGQTYAQENGYQIDEMGILALYSRIDMLQREDHAVTIAEVKEVMDEAMEHSQKASAKKLVKRVLGKNRDDSDRIILTEKDFN